MTALVERAKQQGVVRPDFDQTDLVFIQVALSAVMDSTRAVSSGLYRRYLTMLLDGIRADREAFTPLPAAALTADQTHIAMTRKRRAGSRHAVVATGRGPERVAAAVGDHHDLAVVKLDVTSVDDAEAAAQAAVDRFGKIDVLVNNAGNFYAGFFEEITLDDFRAQVETNLFGPSNVARAVLPFMREQRSGLVMAISSTGGIFGQEFCTAYLLTCTLAGSLEELRPHDDPDGQHDEDSRCDDADQRPAFR
jgi:short chain dehydrogenase